MWMIWWFLCVIWCGGFVFGGVVVFILIWYMVVGDGLVMLDFGRIEFDMFFFFLEDGVVCSG